MQADRALFTQLQASLAAGGDAVLLTVIKTEGTTPRGPGAKMLYTEGGKTYGTIGGGSAEFEATRDARHVLQKRISRTARYAVGYRAGKNITKSGEVTVFLQYFAADDQHAREMADLVVQRLTEVDEVWLMTRMYNDGDWDMAVFTHEHGLWPPLSFTGAKLINVAQSVPVLHESTVNVYCEPLARKGTVYVFGGGHVARALVPVLAALDFRVVVYEDREEFAKEEFFPDAERILHGKYTGLTDKIQFAEEDFIIVMTRDNQGDYDVLRRALRSPASYIGMIGSMEKTAVTKARLLAAGYTQEDYARVKTPIGLDIGAETPPEIAVSIAAELIQKRAGLRKK